MNITEQAKEILDYWYAIEYLQPNDFPKLEVSKANFRAKEKDLFHTYCFEMNKYRSIGNILSDTEKDRLKSIDDEIQICVGKIKIKPIIEYIFDSVKEEAPENYPSESICLFSLRVDLFGNYIKNSMQISPFILCCSTIAKEKNLDLCNLGPEEANEYCQNNFEEYLLEDKSNLFDKIQELYQNICKDLLFYIDVNNIVKGNQTLIIFNKYKNDKAKNNMQSENKYSDLQQSYFLKDIDFIKDNISHDTSILKYILALNNEVEYKSDMRVDKEEISKWIVPKNFPNGRWPSSYNPTFMQQLAINIGSLENSDVDKVFSVNGPPGTGKTTLLKEIVVANIVERANLITKYKSPDDAFKREKLTNLYDEDTSLFYVPDSDLIKFGILVLSSNNGAVENITIDLPEAEQMKNEKTRTQRFDLSKCEHQVGWKNNDEIIEKKEIYFSYPAETLNEKSEKWGFISAPLGKKSNINNFCKALSKIIFHSWKKDNEYSGKKSFEKAKEAFLIQYDIVSEMKQEMSDSINEERKVKKLEIKFKVFINENNKEIEKKSKDNLELIRQADEYKKETIELELKIKESDRLIASFESEFYEITRSLIKLQDERNIVERLFPEPTNFCTRFLAKLFHTERVTLIQSEKQNKKKCNRNIESEKQNKVKFFNDSNLLIQKEKEALFKIDNNKKDIKSLQERQDKEREIFLKEKEKFQKNRKELENRGIKFLSDKFLDELIRKDSEAYNECQCEQLFAYEEYDKARELLFYDALMLHKSFYIESSYLHHNMKMLLKYWGNTKDKNGLNYSFSKKDREKMFTALFNSLFLLIPVLSSTFASVQTLLQDVPKENSLGLMVVDEAGQATPQMAIGALWRSKRAIIVGDPKQIEPVVTIPDCIYKKMFERKEILSKYINRTLSVQAFGDKLNKYSGKLIFENGDDLKEEWVGCPLVVHRRCIEPMFKISNKISYGEMMVSKTPQPSEKMCNSFYNDFSLWIQCEGNEIGKINGEKNHFVPKQGEIVYKIIKECMEKNSGLLPDLFIISPFKSVVKSFKAYLGQYKEMQSEETKAWIEKSCGTVHTFQGKEAEQVIYMLGCDHKSLSAAKWVNSNNVNVAVTRAKYRVYFIGDKAIWKDNEYVRTAYSHLKEKTLDV